MKLLIDEQLHDINTDNLICDINNQHSIITEYYGTMIGTKVDPP